MQRHVFECVNKKTYNRIIPHSKEMTSIQRLPTQRLPQPFFVYWYVTYPETTLRSVSACSYVHKTNTLKLIETVNLKEGITFSVMKSTRFLTYPVRPKTGMFVREDLQKLIEEFNPGFNEFYERHPVQTIPAKYSPRKIKGNPEQYELDL